MYDRNILLFCSEETERRKELGGLLQAAGLENFLLIHGSEIEALIDYWQPVLFIIDNQNIKQTDLNTLTEKSPKYCQFLFFGEALPIESRKTLGAIPFDKLSKKSIEEVIAKLDDDQDDEISFAQKLSEISLLLFDIKTNISLLQQMKNTEDGNINPVLVELSLLINFFKKAPKEFRTLKECISYIDYWIGYHSIENPETISSPEPLLKLIDHLRRVIEVSNKGMDIAESQEFDKSVMSSAKVFVKGLKKDGGNS